jgi:hypothetical protein
MLGRCPDFVHQQLHSAELAKLLIPRHQVHRHREIDANLSTFASDVSQAAVSWGFAALPALMKRLRHIRIIARFRISKNMMTIEQPSMARPCFYHNVKEAKNFSQDYHPRLRLFA